MSERTVISCDASGCCNEHEEFGGGFILGDIKGWIYCQESETHYCPSCIELVRPELDEDGVEYEIID
jgi:hypothetical protein